MNDERKHIYFNREKLAKWIGLGIAKWVDDALFVKCHGCFRFKAAKKRNFDRNKKTINHICKNCRSERY